jgi:TPR repeat protein
VGAIGQLGGLYEDGSSDVEASVEAASEWYSFGADLGDARCQNNLGALWHSGAISGKREVAKGVKLFRAAAASMHAAALHNLGVCHETGVGCEQDAAQARAYYAEAAARDHALAAAALAYCFMRNGRYKEAMRTLRRALLHPTPAAASLFYMAQLYELGYECDRCPSTALAYYARAAAAGHAAAQAKVGDYHFAGAGGVERKDAHDAFTFYKRAAAQGHTGAMNSLGLLLEAGDGCVRSYEQAMHWYVTAATPDAVFNQVSSHACNAHRRVDVALVRLFIHVTNHFLFTVTPQASLHLYGLGVPCDARKATSLYKEAADSGCVQAKVLLQQRALRAKNRNRPLHTVMYA